MTPPGKSAALRLPPYQDEADTGAAGFEAAIRNAAAARMRPRPAESARDTLVAFRSPEARTTLPPPAEAAPDLGTELESALMNDLQSMVALFDEVARTPSEVPASPTQVAAEPARAADSDQEALDRLLASIRQNDSAPRRPSPAPADDVTPARAIDEAPVAIAALGDEAAPTPPLAFEAEAAPLPKRNPRSPRPGNRDDRLASPVPRPRKAAASAAVAPRIPSKAEPVPALRVAIPGNRRAYVKPAIAVSLLILLATVGAGMTIRALTARNDTAPASGQAKIETPAVAEKPVETVSTPPAKVDAAPATASAAPTTVAKAETQPMAAAMEPAEPARAAVDNSAPQHALPAEMTAPTVMQAAPMPVPKVPLQPAMTSTEPVAMAPAEAATLDTAPAATEPTAAAPKAASESVTTAGALKPGAGRIASGVKLRTNPDNGAPVIAVLGQGTDVQIVSCKGWCEIVAGEKRGFVYQKFLAQAGG